MESTVHPQLLQKFKLSHPFPVDPFKKIDWSNFKKILLEPDREILKTFDRFQRNGGGAVVTISPRAFEYAPFAVSEALRGLSHYKYPFCFIPNIVDYDKEEIFEQIAQQIDSWRKIETIKKLRHRDHINKFHLYTQVWEWRKDRIPFSKMPGTEATNISRYRKAGKLLGYPGTAHEGDRKVCDNCDERASGCKIPCPDLLFHLAKVENKRKEKLSPHYNLIMDKQVHADWLQKELENH
jgi:hypothetical protein